MGANFDPLDTTRGIPYEELARLRAEEPVYRTPSGVWYLALQDDVLAATEAIDVFQSSFREPGVVVPEQEQLISEIPEPRHGQVRRIVNSAIAFHKLGRVEPFVRGLAEPILDELAARGHGELVSELILPIPNSAIAFLLGVPPSDFELWARWSDEVVLSDYPARNRTERGEGLAGAFPEFAAYVDAQIEERRRLDAPPEQDFIARLVRTEVDGRRLGDVELRTLIVFLLISGNETTRHLLGNLLCTVATRPEIYAQLRARPELVSNAVEESLRLDPPVAVLMRDCIRDTEVRGVRIRKGEKVAFGLASANRDERYYEEPDVFRLDRPQPKAHLAFGGGPHVCPGSALARLEGRVVLATALERIAELRAAPGFRRSKVGLFWANGPTELPVELRAAA